MQVTFNNFNTYGNNKDFTNNNLQKTNYRLNYGYQPSYTGNGASKIFDPAKKGFDNLSEWLAKNYYAKFYRSKFAQKFIEKTSNVKNMTTHMAAIGSTLISGMYTIRTLQNDKLDPDRRKTLALNDVLTWAISTIGAYTIDSALNKKWDNVTNRFVANYINKYKDEIFKNEDFKKILDNYCEKNNISKTDLNKHILTRYNNHLEESLDKYCKENNLNKNNLDAKTLKLFEKVPVEGDFDAKYLNIYMREYNKIINEHNANVLKTNAGKLLENATNIREFNLDLLKSRKLTTMIDGMGILKSLFVFGLVYRYLVPVVVMKPANKLGAYMHKKQSEKEQLNKPEKA